MIKVAIITISDTRSKENDITGKKLLEMFDSEIYEIYDYRLIMDDIAQISDNLIDISSTDVQLILTNGGTGFGSRDVTPEATKMICEKEVPGLSELMRYEGGKNTNKSYLSRGISGIRNQTLIINLPGSPKGATESLQAILPLLEHAVAMLNDAGH